MNLKQYKSNYHEYLENQRIKEEVQAAQKRYDQTGKISDERYRSLAERSNKRAKNSTGLVKQFHQTIISLINMEF